MTYLIYDKIRFVNEQQTPKCADGTKINYTEVFRVIIAFNLIGHFTADDNNRRSNCGSTEHGKGSETHREGRVEHLYKGHQAK